MRSLSLALLTLVAGCGPASEPVRNVPHAAGPPSDALDPNKAPHAWSTFNVDAIRAGKHTSRLVGLLRRALPPDVSIDDVSWLSVDGSWPLDRPSRNIAFIALRDADVVERRGAEVSNRVAARPTPPDAARLVDVRVRAPAKMLRIPFFEPPPSVDELTLAVDGREDGGATIRLIERCSDPKATEAARLSLERMVTRVKGTKTSALLLDLLANATVSVTGEGAVVDVSATGEQVEAAVELAMALLQGP